MPYYIRMTGDRQAVENVEEGQESPTFCWRVRPLDARDLDTIRELDPDVLNRTDALRAAIRDYARRLRRRSAA